ncbi:MAG: hypothetical protein AAF637_17920 [Pseudomonadota bacterium]
MLAELARQVWTVEIVEELACDAEQRLLQHGLHNVGSRIGDGAQGWPEHAPYDKILVSAAAESCPEPLISQLQPGGRMVLPIGRPDEQRLTLVEKHADGELAIRPLMPVLFSQLETVR